MRHLLLLFASMILGSAQTESPLNQAVAAYRKGDLTLALDILNKQIPLEPDKTDYYLLRGDIHSMQGQNEKAAENYSEVIRRKGDGSAAFYRRGMEYFRLGKMRESIADFDKFVELHPDRAPQLWQRGIAYYYAGEFEKGRRQFESHQTVNSHDVENAVWHFLCVAKLDGFEKARLQLIPISGDTRVPMAQVQKVFAGTAKADEVLDAAKVGGPDPDLLKDRLFYAHLYLGLYEEAKGDAKASLEHMRKAAGEFGQKHYMGDVARVHLTLRTK